MKCTLTKEEFEKVLNENKPNKFIVWFFKHIIKEKSFQFAFMSVLIGGFLVGFVETILKGSRTSIMIPTLITGGLLLFYGLVYYYVVIANNMRIRRIRRKLGVSDKEYNNCLDEYESKD